MLRIPIKERSDWRMTANEFGFRFHTFDGEEYWTERYYYQFSLQQIERDLEVPTEELNQMCLAVVNDVISSDALMAKFAIPKSNWDLIRKSWHNEDPSLYGRFDFSYDGRNPAKLLEANFDTPTSAYECGFWQWIWLEDNVKLDRLSRGADQFNSFQEKFIERLATLAEKAQTKVLYFACSLEGGEEDYGTVTYFADCARVAGLTPKIIYIEDIGVDAQGNFTDLNDHVIRWLFKLYPYEMLFREDFSKYLDNGTLYLEPPWKAIISNKAILPLLWEKYPHHPNLLPAYFADKKHLLDDKQGIVKKPIFSREGANVKIEKDGKVIAESDGFYGEEGYIYQAFHPLPKFGDDYTVIGSWVIGDKAAGLSIREDNTLITKDSSRFIPHIIL